MSKCDLSFELERDDATFRPGEKLVGHLDVLVDANCRCDGLEITLGWQTHGKGNRDKGPPLTERLGPFEWQAGQRHRYDFSFDMPDGPVSYHGHLINVDWYLRARADIPWALDPKTEAEVLLEPAEAEQVAASDYRSPPQPIARAHNLGGGAMPTIPPKAILVVAIVFIAFISFFLWPFVEDGQVIWPKVLFAAIACLAIGRMLYSQMRNAVAKSKLGDVRVELDPGATSRGQSVRVTITVRPGGGATIDGVNLELEGQEIAVSGSGTNRTTHRHRLHHQALPISEGRRQVAAGEVATFEGQVTLPEDAAPTFRASNNNLRWNVVAHVDIPRWPDLREERELVVYPS